MSETTSRQIMDATGIANSVTLTRWHQMGLIPEPTTRTHPSGRGKMSYWPEWVLHHCKRIKLLRQAGRSLDEIKKLLGDDWDETARQYSRRYRFKEVSEQMDRAAAVSNLCEVVEELLRDWITKQQMQLRSKRIPIISGEIAESALALLLQGFNPVLVVMEESIQVTADFVVSQYLAANRDLTSVVTVVPLSGELSQYLRGNESFPSQPTTFPSATVMVTTPKGTEDRPFVTVDEWSFEIGVRERRPRRKSEP